jgi:energy-coupling factor transporter ATP-binding protein EcfA2
MTSRAEVWVPLELGTIPDTLEIGTTVRNKRYEDQNVFAENIFLRSHLQEKKENFEDFLESSEFRKMYIDGPPGCGKTTFISLLARTYASRESKRVLVVNYRHGEECPVLEFNGDEVSVWQRPVTGMTLADRVRLFLEHLETPHFDLCIHDGVRQNIVASQGLLGVLNAQTGEGRKISKVVHVTSLAFIIRGGDQLPDRIRVTQEDSFDSWCLADHVLAFQLLYENRFLNCDMVDDIKALKALDDDNDHNDGFATDDDITDDNIKAYVENKFYYAGGCARFMFNFTVERLKKHLHALVERMTEDNWGAFKSSAIPAGTRDAVNSLMQRFTDSQEIGKCTAVSRYILMQAYERCGTDMVEAVTMAAIATGNPVLKGWAFELEQLEVIKKVLKTEL